MSLITKKTTPPKLTLIERAYQLRYDPANPPPEDEQCLSLGEYPIAAFGNLTAVQGKSKSGKSASVSAILGAGMRGNCSTEGDTLSMQWTGEATGAIVHFDTEQSLGDWHHLVSRSVTRSGLPDPSERMVSFPLVMFSRGERLELLRQVMVKESEDKGGVDLVILDGIADLCVSPNDEGEALELVSQVHSLALDSDAQSSVFSTRIRDPTTGRREGTLDPNSTARRSPTSGAIRTPKRRSRRSGAPR